MKKVRMKKMIKGGPRFEEFIKNHLYNDWKYKDTDYKKKIGFKKYYQEHYEECKKRLQNEILKRLETNVDAKKWHKARSAPSIFEKIDKDPAYEHEVKVREGSLSTRWGITKSNKPSEVS